MHSEEILTLKYYAHLKFGKLSKGNAERPKILTPGSQTVQEDRHSQITKCIHLPKMSSPVISLDYR